MAGDRAHAPWSVALDPMVDGRADRGALRSVLQLCGAGATVHLVGPSEHIEDLTSTPLLVDATDAGLRVVLHPAEATLAPDEDPMLVRGRPGLPVRVALDLLADGRVDAVRSAASVDVVLTAAVFRLGRLSGAASTERERLMAAARPGVAVDVDLAAGRLRIIDAGHADRATPTDVLGRILAAETPSARLGVLDATGRRDALVREVLDLARGCGVALRPVSATEAVRGVGDVVGCTPDAGAVMLQVLTTTGADTTGLGHVIGVPGDVAAILPSALAHEPAVRRG